ncbi:MAG: short chain dehydrogenase [Methanoregula sp. PtaU1.Bin051]|nr:MAG: short chain dehydrogenase [Methanoregula sp. PtaU1.Bin051]
MPGKDVYSRTIRTVKAGTISIAYSEAGAGPPLVLINGFTSTMDMWNPPVLSALAEHFRVIVFDNRGTGYSSCTDESFSIPLFAQDTLSLMDALGIPQAHILGLSMGASIALELVLLKPERVGKLVLVAGQCGGREAAPIRPEVWATLADKSGTPEEIAGRMFSLLFPLPWLATHDPWKHCPEITETTSEEVAARQAGAFRSWPGCCGRLSEIRIPTLIITGTDDQVIVPENSDIIGRHIPGAQVVRFDGAGHGLMYQFPEEFASTVISFLKQP